MKLNISKISKYDGNSIKFSFSCSDKEYEFDFNGETLKFFPPVTVTGSAINEGGMIKVELECSARVERDCGRCLEKYEINSESKGVFNFTREIKDIDDDYYLYENDIIDLSDIVLGELALTLDMKPLCSDDCAGLCMTCGENLNKSTCNCNQEKIDPRFAALSKFFDTNQGGV